MPVTQTWDVDRLDCFASQSGKTNVVTVVYWTLTTTDGTTTRTTYGTIRIAPYLPGGAFIEYINLSLAQVLAWAHVAMGPEKLELELGMERELQYAPPPTVHPELPWAT